MLIYLYTKLFIKKYENNTKTAIYFVSLQRIWVCCTHAILLL